MRFLPNLSTIFANRTDLELVEKFNEAKFSGFSSCEMQDDWTEFNNFYPLEHARSTAEIELTLINSPKSHDDVPRKGYACFSAEEFYKTISYAVTCCDFLKVKKLHVLAGNIDENISDDGLQQLYVENLILAANYAQEYNVSVVIEPMCPEVAPNYFLNSFTKAVDLLEKINSTDVKPVKLLLDIFHLYKIEGEDKLEEAIVKYLPYTGHIQVSQAPNRNEPLAEGEINYEKVFKILADNGYDGDIGLEYTPTNTENPDFEWIKKYM